MFQTPELLMQAVFIGSPYGVLKTHPQSRAFIASTLKGTEENLGGPLQVCRVVIRMCSVDPNFGYSTGKQRTKK